MQTNVSYSSYYSKMSCLIRSSQGISTTSLIQRVLHPNLLDEVHMLDDTPLRQLLASFSESCNPPLFIFDAGTDRMTTGSLRGNESAYIASSWDCFCSAHVEMLKKAKDTAIKESGKESSLIVGVWRDQVCILFDA